MHFISKKHMPLGLFVENIKTQGAEGELQVFPHFPHKHESDLSSSHCALNHKQKMLIK